ncbi:MAG: UDP binding domain-containing protein, partial [Candidatus Binatia bacterium]
VLERLRAKGAELTILDPVAEPQAVSNHGFKLLVEGDLDAAMFDLAVILTDHDGIDYEALASRFATIFDSRGAFRRRGITASSIFTL